MTSDEALKQWLLTHGSPSPVGSRMLDEVVAEYGGFGARHTARALQLSADDFEAFKHCTNQPAQLLGMYLLSADVLFAPESGAESEDLMFHEGVHACTPKQVFVWFYSQELNGSWTHRGRLLMEALTEFLTEEAGYDEGPRAYDPGVDLLYEARLPTELAARAMFAGDIRPLRNFLADAWGVGPEPIAGYDPICQAFRDRWVVAEAERGGQSNRPHPWNAIRPPPQQGG